MSAKVENNKPNDGDSNQNDWDLDDDSWDDWGDAEDEANNDTQPTPTSNSQQIKTKPVENNNVHKVPERTQIPAKENNNFSSRPPPDQVKPSGGGGWGSLFGGVMSSVLNTATELTSTVTQGLDKVIGVPDPAEMARINASEEARLKAQNPKHEDKPPNEKLTSSQQEDDENEDRSLTPTKITPVFGLSLVNNVTSLGSKVLNTGLDTLEGIGKKTMTILQENDPLLKNKIKKLGLEKEKPNLTEVS